MKKIVSLLLALCLVMGIGAALADDKVELTAFQYALENQNCDFNNDFWYFQQIEEKTNTHVTFDMVKDSDWATKANLMFSIPDQMPDMILRHAVDVEEYGVSQGLLLPLDEYLTEEIMPNYVSRMNLNHASDSIPASDGKTYYIGYLMAQNVNHNGTWYVNQTELDKLGLEAPKTIDEVTEMLRKMKADGFEFPMSASSSKTGPEGILNFFASFGVPENQKYYFIDENDKVQFTGAQPGWRACVEWLHQLYEEGLLDPESLTQDSNLWASKVNEGKVGYFTYLRLKNTAITADNIGNYKSILPPAADGFKVSVSSILEVPEVGAYLTKNCKDPVAALKWIDAQLETEMMMVAGNGKVGEQIIKNDAGKYEVINVPENNGLYDFVPVIMGQFFAPGDYYTEIYQMAPHRVERYEDSKAYAEAGVLEYKSYQYLRDLCKMNNDDAIEASDIYTELEKAVDEAFAKFVREGVTDESWDAFQAQTKSIGVDRYIELYQNAYDAFLAK